MRRLTHLQRFKMFLPWKSPRRYAAIGDLLFSTKIASDASMRKDVFYVKRERSFSLHRYLSRSILIRHYVDRWILFLQNSLTTMLFLACLFQKSSQKARKEDSCVTNNLYSIIGVARRDATLGDEEG